MRLPYVEYLGSYTDGLQMMHIYAIDAPYVRAHYPEGIDFTMGGHHEVYPWIPDNEIWLDSDLRPSEIWYTLHYHELPEHYRMKFLHQPYSKAHDAANAIELDARRKYAL